MNNPLYGPMKDYYLKYLGTISKELAAYPDTETLWKVPEGISNSGGTLILHLCGNLQHFLGHFMAGTEYKRDRVKEFAARDLSAQSVQTEIDRTEVAVRKAFEKLTEDDLSKKFEGWFSEDPVTVGFALYQFLTHLSYHTGQINYHRRMCTAAKK